MFENGAHVRTATLTVFQEITEDFFYSINHRQSVNTQLTHPPPLCLAGWFSATKPAGHDRQRLCCKEHRQFAEQNASLCDPPHPQGINPGPSPWYQLVARHLGCLSQPSLTEPPPPPQPGFSSTAKASQLSPACIRKSLVPKSTPCSKIQTYIGLECRENASS